MSRRVGVLALQGGVVEHARMVEELRSEAVLVRRAGDLDRLDALILPGGESTALLRLLAAFDLTRALADTARAVPTLGTCAGLILLARLGVLDVDVERNAFGPQVDSAEAVLPWRGGQVRAALIRAPRITRMGEGVEALSTWTDPRRPDEAPSVVGVEQTGAGGRIIGVAFHPELTGDTTIHRELLA
ncbi:pyridoxal 5'-phosphate synthase glutaminase subunit PdxT [Actinomyces marmotae]|uniref:pyridoxal 5'-phosphate synthase glutaminase subunit PdxT n=1 Tax=Actinomyces marmotae TaxID=2737173 RepID=UPI001F20DD90|nr:pyridoxal 5'-phosphate synthase glutaminase subunit PdxT [Actinomyces marmotae]